MSTNLQLAQNLRPNHSSRRIKEDGSDGLHAMYRLILVLLSLNLFAISFH